MRNKKQRSKNKDIDKALPYKQCLNCGTELNVIGSCAYLTAAFHHVYKTGSWIKAMIKAMVISIICMFNKLCLVFKYLVFDQ